MVFTDQPVDFRPKFHVVGCYLEHDGTLLLIKRHPDKPQGGTWCIPGGKVEQDETLTGALYREIREEVSVDISNTSINPAHTSYVRHHGYEFIYHTFHVHMRDQPSVTLDPSDATEYRWVPLRDVLNMPLMDDEDTCIRRYFGKTASDSY